MHRRSNSAQEGSGGRCRGACSGRPRACDSTVWMDGMSRPCATPTATRATMVAGTLAAVPGVSRHAVDHSAKEAMSVRRPPQRCAAQPPGTCVSGDGLQTHRSVERRQSSSARVPMLPLCVLCPEVIRYAPCTVSICAATPGLRLSHQAACLTTMLPATLCATCKATNTAWKQPRLPQGEAECEGAWRACDTAYPQKKADSTVPLTASEMPACLAIAVKAIEKPTRSTYAVNVARKQASTMRWRAWGKTCQGQR